MKYRGRRGRDRMVVGLTLFHYLYDADFIQGLLKKNKKKLARSFNFMFRNISLKNSKFGDFVDDTVDTVMTHSEMTVLFHLVK
jgi:hypothetical protein